ncbi:MAG: alpha/beta hydrolase [Bacteroidetes bacterium]|nr:alpha/beta hydrolase [Bacteroidota bacterium]
MKFPLILLHGALGSSSQFDSLKEKLLRNNQVHSFNFAGHGGKAIPDQLLSIDMFTEEVLSFIEQHKLESVNIFGYSMGGYVAVNLAHKVPGKVKAIMTLATKFDWSPESSLKEIAMLDVTKMEQKIPDFVRELNLLHVPNDWKLLVEKLVLLMKNLGENPIGNDAFKSIQIPIRLLVGDNDKMVSVQSTYEVFKQFVHGSMVVLPDTLHPFEYVNQERLLFEISDFFK